MFFKHVGDEGFLKDCFMIVSRTSSNHLLTTDSTNLDEVFIFFLNSLLPDGITEAYQKRNQYSYLKWFLKGVLTEMLRS